MSLIEDGLWYLACVVESPLDGLAQLSRRKVQIRPVVTIMALSVLALVSLESATSIAKRRFEGELYGRTGRAGCSEEKLRGITVNGKKESVVESEVANRISPKASLWSPVVRISSQHPCPLLAMPPRGNEGLDFTPILTHYLFLFTSILAVVCLPHIGY